MFINLGIAGLSSLGAIQFQVTDFICEISRIWLKREVMSRLRVLIADDERPARLFLKNLLGGFEDVEIVGEAEDGAEALELIKEIKPDLVFLDLQMPELSGLQVVKLLPENCRLLIVFVTADETGAAEMFEAGSIDYLLKPVGREELRDVFNRVKSLVQSRLPG